MERLVLIALIALLASPAGAAPVWEVANPTPAAVRLAAEDVRAEAKAAPEGSVVAVELTRRAAMLDQLAGIIEARRPGRRHLGAERRRLTVASGSLAAEEREPGPIPSKLTTAQLEQIAAEAAAARSEVDRLEKARATAEARLEATPRLLEEARQRARAARARAAEASERRAGASDPSEKAIAGVEAENAALEARVAEEEIAQLTAEGQDREPLELLDLELDLAERRHRLLNARLVSWQHALQEQLAADEVHLRAAASAAEKAAAHARGPFERFVAAEQLRVAQANLDVAERERTRVDLERSLAVQRERLAIEREELEGVREAITEDPRGGRTAQRLKETFHRLQRRQQALRRDASDPALAQVAAARARRLDVGDALAGFTERWLSQTDSILARSDDASRPKRSAALDRLRETVRRALRRQRSALTAFIAAGEALRSVQTERARVFDELDKVVRTRIFWVQDADRLWSDLETNAGAEIGRVRAWARRLRGDATLAALGDLARDPLELLLAICAVLLLPIGQLFARRWLRPLVRREADSLGGRLRGIAVGVALASLTSASLWLASLLVGRSGLPSDLQPTLQALLLHLALCVWAWQLIRLFFARDGVLVAHFGLAVGQSLELSRALRLTWVAYALFLLPDRLMSGPPIHAIALPRLGWVAFGVGVLYALSHALRRRGSMMNALQTLLGDREGAASLAAPIRLVALGAVGGVVAMEVAGYRYGAGRLANGLAMSALVLGPLALAWRAALAWLAQREDPVSEGPPPGRWLKPLFVVTAVLLLALVWGVDQGAVRLLDGITLYQLADDRAVTLLDLGGAVLTLLIAVQGVRALPRIMGAVVFPYFALDAGLEYAIVTIARYLLFFVGLLVALASLHVDLGKLGWLMAALGVGLGFGLQEIVSNFVSGIILLVERPLSVGDFISVGPLEGRVLRINIRATTLTSIDKRELIVPNKDLITKEVTNWTRGDKVIRITVPVGVAYGTDVALVTRTLREVAAAEPLVVADPHPEVIFTSHGESSLDFELLVHVPDPWIRFVARDRLNAAINAAFAREGIQIPFPQRDLHIRSGSLSR